MSKAPAREEQIRADIHEGLRQSAAGQVVDLGSFEQFADDQIEESN